MVAVIAWLEVCIESLLKSSGNIVVIKSEWEFGCFAELEGRGRVAGIGFGIDNACDAGENAGAGLQVSSSDIDFQVCLLGDDVFCVTCVRQRYRRLPFDFCLGSMQLPFLELPCLKPAALSSQSLT